MHKKIVIILRISISKNCTKIKPKHCVKSVPFRSYSGPYFPAFGLNTKRYSARILLSYQSKKKNHYVMTRESNIGSFLYEWTKWPNEVNKELKVYRYTISDTWSTGQSEKLRQYLHQGTQGYRSSVDWK